MSYTVLARRYRSETFADLVGQEALTTTLANALTSGRIAHAFLFTGVRGVGKTSAARILAKSLNCLESKAPTPKPCLKCSSCTAVHQGEDIDVIEIDGASNNKVENIHELCQNAVYRPNRSRFKVYIIDEVHMLTNQAFNALLKTLEEPPEHVKFIFATTEPQKIPATILSRCQRYDFRTIGESDIAQHLQKILQSEKIPAEQAAVEHIARLAAGSMRDALSILDQLLSVGQKKLTSAQLEQTLGRPNFRLLLDTVGALAGHDVSTALTGLDELIRLGHSLDQIVSALIEHCRSLMLLLTCGKDTKLVLAGRENRKALLEQAAKLDVPTVVFFISVFEELGRSIRFSSSARALCEAAMVRLAARENFVSTEAIIGLLESGRS
ncbi:MAG: DNA polymerase III subunit gamma/tau, partial [Actinobacteria bacterium]|nr:DNA polymerase III subunit gamma/tau [Actinomycetota bacterium]